MVRKFGADETAMAAQNETRADKVETLSHGPQAVIFAANAGAGSRAFGLAISSCEFIGLPHMRKRAGWDLARRSPRLINLERRARFGRIETI